MTNHHAVTSAPDPADQPKDSFRSQLGRLGAHTKWAMTEDRTAATQPARDGLMRKFEDQVDPGRVLSPQERARRAESAKRAHFQRMALKSAQARRERGGGRAKSVDSDGS